jgi:PleD family two-component response regulator
MTASAGVAALEPGLSAGEVLRRATLCLATARTVGAGQVITYTGTR